MRGGGGSVELKETLRLIHLAYIYGAEKLGGNVGCVGRALVPKNPSLESSLHRLNGVLNACFSRLGPPSTFLSLPFRPFFNVFDRLNGLAV